MNEEPVGPPSQNGERHYILHRSALAASLADATGAAPSTRTPPGQPAPPAAPAGPAGSSPPSGSATPSPATAYDAPAVTSAQAGVPPAGVRRRSSLARLKVTPALPPIPARQPRAEAPLEHPTRSPARGPDPVEPAVWAESSRPFVRAWRPSDDDILPHRRGPGGGFRLRRGTR